MSLLAKSDPPLSLYEHTRDVLQVAEHLLSQLPTFSEVLKPFLPSLIVWHDLGKVQPGFQARLYRQAGLPFSSLAFPEIEETIPHALFSLAWIAPDEWEKLAQQLAPYLRSGSASQQEQVKKAKQILLSVVAYHHWRDSVQEEVALGRGLCLLYKEVLEEDNREKLLHLLQKELGALNGWVRVIGWNSEVAEGLARGVALYRYAPPPYLNEWLPQRLGFSPEEAKVWILLSGALLWCDHFASAVESGISASLEKPLQSPLSERAPEEFLRGKNPAAWQLPLASELRDKNAVLIAPTGLGKTEFAFLWATPGRFIYTLPLRAAVHQTYERAGEIFAKGSEDSEPIALLHGDAALYLLQSRAEEVSARESHEMARHLSHAGVIATGDQIFPYAMRPLGYERIYFSLLTGRLIIDEVQAYDPRAAALVVKLIEDIVSLGGQFLLITATLPPFIKEELCRGIIEEGDIVNYYETLPAICRHKVEVRLYPSKKLAESLKEEIERIVCQSSTLPYAPSEPRKARVLIVVNTVSLAQEIYKVLQKEFGSLSGNASKASKKSPSKSNTCLVEVKLLHSLFTYGDRQRKEEELRQRWAIQSGEPRKAVEILVATQVVEAALDIDADYLFTELAPADALVQRMGRIARRFRADDPTVRPPQSPNVFIWVPKEKGDEAALSSSLASGQGKIYEKELLELTLLGLKLLAEGSTNLVADIQKPTLSDEGSKSRSRLPGGFTLPEESFDITERAKQHWVEAVYGALQLGSPYLRAFQEMLQAARAGIVAEGREEAQRLFRQLVQVPVLPHTSWESCKEAIRGWVSKFKERELSDPKVRQKLYGGWKQEIEARFIVGVPFYLVSLSRGDIRLRKSPEIRAEEVGLLAEDPLFRWLQRQLRVYELLEGYTYSSEEGLFVEEGTLPTQAEEQIL
ncbi:MAG: CRISPR-associated helicase Cas3' [Bacteroidia bacterium]|nr:CRISPR-associated helicase Cas3' [Bacteroidia bacterium]